MAQIRLDLDEADGELPDVCMCCGDEATATKTKTMQWTPPWVGVLIIAGFLPYLIVALIMTKRAQLQAPFCDRHKGHWLYRTLLIIGSGVVFAMMALFSVVIVALLPAPRNEDFFGYICLGCVVLFVVWIVIIIAAQNTAIRAHEITEDELVLDGVSQEFADVIQEQERKRRARRRKARRGDDDDEDDDDRPRRKKRPVDEDDDDDDRPRRKKRPVDEDDDDDDRPRRKKRAPVDEDEDEPPRRKKRPPSDAFEAD